MVFFVSDRTGITAEALGNTLLTQFDGIDFRRTTLPFINSRERAEQAVGLISEAAGRELERPLIFSTTVNDEIRAILRTAPGSFLDLFDSHIPDLERGLNRTSTPTVGRSATPPTPVFVSPAIAPLPERWAIGASSSRPRQPGPTPQRWCDLVPTGGSTLRSTTKATRHSAATSAR